MIADQEPTEYVQAVCRRMMRCRDQETLDETLNQHEIERALIGYPDRPSITVTLYLMNQERIKRRLRVLPAWAVTEKKLDIAALRLGLVYLRRLGFVTSFHATPKFVAWKCNPMHPLANTSERLKALHPALHHVARELWTHDAVHPSTGLPALS